MFTLRAILLRLRVWLIVTAFRTERALRTLVNGAPYYSKFPPDRRFTIKSTVSSRKIRINVYEPDGFDENKSYPVHINLHGSGWILPMFGTDGDFCRMISTRTGAIVLDSDYAKATVWPFPAAPLDVKDVIEHVVANAEGYYDTSKISIGGFSAGGAMAMTSLASQPKGTIKGIIAMYPSADMSKVHKTEDFPPLSEGNTTFVTTSFIQLIFDSYIPPNTDLSDPRLSAVNVPVSLFPEHILFIVCEEDPLRAEATEFAKKLKAGGVNVVSKQMPKAVHGWDKEVKEGMAKGWDTRNEAYEAAVDMLKLVYKS